MYCTRRYESCGSRAEVERMLHIGPELLGNRHRHTHADADAGRPQRVRDVDPVRTPGLGEKRHSEIAEESAISGHHGAVVVTNLERVYEGVFCAVPGLGLVGIKITRILVIDAANAGSDGGPDETVSE